MSHSSSYSTTSPPSCSLSSAIILSWCGVFLSCLCGCELFFFFSPLIFRGISLQFKTCRISTRKFMNEAPSNRHFRDANLSGFFFQPTSLGSRNRAKKRIDPIPGPQTAQPTSTKLQTRFTKKRTAKHQKNIKISVGGIPNSKEVIPNSKEVCVCWGKKQFWRNINRSCGWSCAPRVNFTIPSLMGASKINCRREKASMDFWEKKSDWYQGGGFNGKCSDKFDQPERLVNVLSWLRKKSWDVTSLVFL